MSQQPQPDQNPGNLVHLNYFGPEVQQNTPEANTPGLSDFSLLWLMRFNAVVRGFMWLAGGTFAALNLYIILFSTTDTVLEFLGYGRNFSQSNRLPILRWGLGFLAIALVVLGIQWWNRKRGVRLLKRSDAATEFLDEFNPYSNDELGAAWAILVKVATDAERTGIRPLLLVRRGWSRLKPFDGRLQSVRELIIALNGTPQEFRQTFLGTERAAKAGNLAAMHNLAYAYCRGDGTKQDFQRGIEWFRRAAESGHSVAMLNLGIIYRTGMGVPCDEQRAFEWYLAAAKRGNAKAMICVAKFYEEGKSVPRNPEMAADWLRRAAVLGTA